VLGSSNPYSQAGENQISVTSRTLHSQDHYNGAVEQVQRQTLGTYVINKQRAADLTFTHTFTERISASVAIPYINSSWGIPTPTSPTPGERINQNGRGLGDIIVSGAYWVLPTDRYRKGNVSVSAGLKTPTGNAYDMDTYVGSNGQNNIPRPVDESVQPGDGGWGMTMGVFGFRRIPHAQLFGSLNYLANPKDHNNTPSLAVARLAPGQSPTGDPSTWVNTVPDQYLARLGGAFPLKWGLAGSAAWRVEGMPRYDLIGASHGFRRPGVEMFIEPGITWARGSHIIGFQAPIGYYRNRFPNPYSDSKGDATFPKSIWLANYSYRFGGKAPISTSICQ
jgi:hypothetical protein